MGSLSLVTFSADQFISNQTPPTKRHTTLCARAKSRGSGSTLIWTSRWPVLIAENEAQLEKRYSWIERAIAKSKVPDLAPKEQTKWRIQSSKLQFSIHCKLQRSSRLQIPPSPSPPIGASVRRFEVQHNQAHPRAYPCLSLGSSSPLFPLAGNTKPAHSSTY